MVGLDRRPGKYHAYVKGIDISEQIPQGLGAGRKIRYVPQKDSWFVYADAPKEVIHYAKFAVFSHRELTAFGGESYGKDTSKIRYSGIF